MDTLFWATGLLLWGALALAFTHLLLSLILAPIVAAYDTGLAFRNFRRKYARNPKRPHVWDYFKHRCIQAFVVFITFPYAPRTVIREIRAAGGFWRW